MDRPYAAKVFYMDRKIASRDRRVEEAMEQAKFDVIMGDADVCPEFHKHTNAPRDWYVWREWAEKMSKTHRQIMCKTCKVHAIWEPKKKPRKK